MKNAMKDIINSDSLLNALSKKEEFTKSITEDGSTQFKLLSDFGHGKIEQIKFSNDLRVINFDLKLKEDLIIEIPTSSTNTLYFAYTLNGVSYHSYANSERYSKINELKSVAFSSNDSHKNLIIIEKGHQFTCQILSISIDKYFENFKNQFNSEERNSNGLSSVFEHLKSNFFECAYDLNIANELRSIEKIDIDGCVTSNLQLQSRYQLVLAIHIDHIYNAYHNKGEDLDISKSDIKKIRAISNHITDNPGLNHSQDNLCSQFFVSQSKLQAGFKAIHDMTVSNFTRNVRLEKSEELLCNSDLNISEIVYTVGFTSRSYFSKIFKMKYGCNPTSFKKHLKSKQLVTVIH